MQMLKSFAIGALASAGLALACGSAVASPVPVGSLGIAPVTAPVETVQYYGGGPYYGYGGGYGYGRPYGGGYYGDRGPYGPRGFYGRPAYGPRVVCRVRPTPYGPRRVCFERY